MSQDHEPDNKRKPYWWVEPTVFWVLAVIIALAVINGLVQEYL